MTEIEKGIPIPPARVTKGAVVWPYLEKLAVNECVFVMHHSALVAGGLQAWYRANGRKKRFITRTEGLGCRIWRVE